LRDVICRCGRFPCGEQRKKISFLLKEKLPKILFFFLPVFHENECCPPDSPAVHFYLRVTLTFVFFSPLMIFTFSPPPSDILLQ
jgi:hypothetical protein